MERFAVLVRRHGNVIDVSFTGLLAGIDATVFILLLGTIVCLLALSYVNERRIDEHQNSVWSIVHLLIPGNTMELNYESGCTRKVLIITCGLAVFISSAYYQSNLLQQLLIPLPAPRITFTDIVAQVKRGDTKIYMNSDAWDLITDLHDFKEALDINQPHVGITSLSDMHDLILNNNAALLIERSVILFSLSELEPDMCALFTVVEVHEIIAYHAALILHKHRRDALEALNVVIAERQNFIDDLIHTKQLNDECRNHIFPPHVAEPRFLPLSMYTLSGTFVMAFILLACAVCAFVVEMCWYHSTKQTQSQSKFDLATHMDNIVANEVLQHIKDERTHHVLSYYYMFRDQLLLHQK
jgi:hypothetical protein